MINDFYKNTLNKRCHLAYDEMVRSFRSMKFEVDVQGVSAQELPLVYSAVLEDHPELFYLSHKPSARQKMGFFGGSLKLVSSSIFTAGQVGNYKIELDKIVKNFKKQTENLSSDSQKILFVCDHFLKNVNYEINNDYNQNCATALIKNKGQCSGISKGVKYLLDHLGIDCIVVEGEAHSNGQGGPHAWNIVWVDGDPYHLDVTNMMGANTSKKEPFYYLYFLASDDDMTVHSWDRNKYPKCNKKCPYKPVNASNNQFGNGNRNSPPPMFSDKVVKFSIEMEKEIAKAVDKKQDLLCFSTALSVEGQELLDEVSKSVRKVVRQKNLGLSFSVKIINGFNVEITFIY